jgi:nucleoid DNA-binding protein
MNKAELIEAMASHAGLSKSDAKRALDGLTSATTKALKKGDRIALIGFGSFSISKRSARTGRNPGSGNGPAGDSPVTFASCPEFAAALDLNPGRGDEASAKCRDADVVIDAKTIANETRGDRKGGLSEADAKRALEGFINATTKALQTGETVSVGETLGSFSISKRSARTGRNPQTGKEIQTAAKKEVRFKAGAELSKAVN